jgi:nucleotide sugar dehydrogenase
MLDCKVAVIGYGTVGRHLCKEISPLNPDVYDKYTDVIIQQHQKANRWDGSEKYDFAFICVDTPLKENGVDLDTSEVASAIHNTNAEIYVIKSTCPVGFTNTLAHFVHKRIVYCPEYYGGTQHCNNYEFNFTILGGTRKDCAEVQQLLQHCYDARHIFHVTDHDTAELVKFMENAWIATKVSFCNQFYDIAKAHGINYDELRELFILDPRVNPSHTFVYTDAPYWDSHCLNKDVPHIANSEASAEFLRSMIEFNQGRRNKTPE